MLRRFGRFLSETVLLWIFLVVYAFVRAAYDSARIGPPAGPELAARVYLPWLIASWVSSDARRRNRGLCYDYDSFLFFAWPVLLPCYLFQSRGWRALLTLAGFVALYLASVGIGAGLHELLSRGSPRVSQ